VWVSSLAGSPLAPSEIVPVCVMAKEMSMVLADRTQRSLPAVVRVIASRIVAFAFTRTSLHAAGEIICVVTVGAPGRPSAVASALTVAADTLNAEDGVRSPRR
jgi:hypothetical protein